MVQPSLSPKLSTQGVPFVCAEYALLLWLRLDYCWQVNGRNLLRPVSFKDWL